MSMKHAGCGGTIEVSEEKVYYHEHDDGTTSSEPALVCSLCRKEILGDAEIEVSDDEELNGHEVLVTPGSKEEMDDFVRSVRRLAESSEEVVVTLKRVLDVLVEMNEQIAGLDDQG